MEKPIIFSTQMVQAILEGRKTQTRRIINPQPFIDNHVWQYPWIKMWSPISPDKIFIKYLNTCPKGKLGDVLWVRETFAPALDDYAYKADYSDAVLSEPRNKGLWKSPLFMHKAAARLWLEVTELRIEKLQNITPQDIQAEGLPENWKDNFASPNEWFKTLWQSINGNWDANPWVWVISFKRINKN